jgi:hypothetical protein
MENKPRRRSRKPQAETLTADVNVTPVAVVDRHSELIDEKISQIISLQNGLSANERMLDELNVKIKDYSKQVMELKADNVRIRTLHNNLDYNLKHAYEQLAKIPNFVKWIYKIK